MDALGAKASTATAMPGCTLAAGAPNQSKLEAPPLPSQAKLDTTVVEDARSASWIA